MNKLLVLGFSALLCCVSAEALRCTVCQNKIPVFGCIKGLGICHPAPGLPCKYIRVYTTGIQFYSQADCAVQGDRCNIIEPTKSGHRQISCCKTDFCNS
ncbi:prostate and testis expressed protein 3-like [Trachemys scripta elegans]|uniref:prostate and testis expressed protein 3-like n=1 Tax=Trachemys scripta elegans TaxID=31138 RepID=UPI00155601F1|nr:prostate and testis expressed protein 3-like [Trachemys scripta elegans]